MLLQGCARTAVETGKLLLRGIVRYECQLTTTAMHSGADSADLQYVPSFQQGDVMLLPFLRWHTSQNHATVIHQFINPSIQRTFALGVWTSS